jgi:hypothetical protein
MLSSSETEHLFNNTSNLIMLSVQPDDNIYIVTQPDDNITVII